MLNKYTVAALYLAALVALRYWMGGHRMHFVCYFLAGSVLYHWRPPLRGAIAASCAAIWLATVLLGGLRLGNATAGAYVVMYLALSPSVKLPLLSRWGDLSYGTYIIAYPVQQCASLALGPAVTWYWNVAIASPVTLLLAFASWHLVEAPSLRLKRIMTRPRAVRLAA